MNEQERLFKMRWGLAVILLFAIGITSCKSAPPPTALPVVQTEAQTAEGSPAKPPNLEAPVTNPAGPEITLDAGEVLAISAKSTGANKYEWTLQGAGELPATTGPAVLYTAPETDTVAIITVTAYNDQGASPSTSITIKVSGVAAIPLDAVGIPAGWMSGGSNPKTFINMTGGEQGECHTNANCLKFTYKIGGSWNGILWWPLKCGESGTPEAWEKVKAGTCGINVLETGGSLTAISSFTFWARGDKGGEVIEFKVGDIAIPPSPGRGLGDVTLTSDWKQYQIDLDGVDLTNATALFTWVATDDKNNNGAVFYLSEIQFEGAK